MATRDGSLSAVHEQPSRAEREREPPETAVAPSDLPGDTGLRPVSVEPGQRLREEAVMELSQGPQARPWYAVVSEWRDWYDGYRRSHIEYEGPDGEIARTRLENSYMPEYGKRYYARLKDLERGIERRWKDLTTVMLTLSASTLNAEGHPRCPADHMREVAEGWKTARKHLYEVLEGRRWEYARVWEPTGEGGQGPAGYGHLHVAIFVEDGGDLDRGDFGPVMESYVGACDPAGWDAHRPDPPGEGEGAVSLNDDVENLGSYVSEYIGIFGEDPLERPMSEQAFYAVTWATRTRRVDFSNGAQDIISGEEFRRETGLRPEDRDDTERCEESESGTESGGSEGWGVRAICTATASGPSYADPTRGRESGVAIEGRPGLDPPRRVE